MNYSDRLVNGSAAAASKAYYHTANAMLREQCDAVLMENQRLAIEVLRQRGQLDQSMSLNAALFLMGMCFIAGILVGYLARLAGV